MDSPSPIPNLFIVGAAKSGTTFLWHNLKNHPNIFVPDDELFKEPAFFSDKGKHLGISQYLEIFKNAGKNHKWVGEASTAYLTDPHSAKQIYTFNPNSKIIIILRDPVERAYSLYNWMVQDGYEYAETFEKALYLEKTRINRQIPNWYEPEYYWNYLYYHSGLYYSQVQRYVELFGENVLVLKFEDVIKNKNKEYKKTFSFLKLHPIELTHQKHNKSYQVHSVKSQFILRKLNDSLIPFRLNSCPISIIKIIQLYTSIIWKLYQENISLDSLSSHIVLIRKIIHSIQHEENLFGSITTKHQRDFLLKIGLIAQPPVPMNSITREKLQHQYKKDILKLENFTNIDLKSWLSSSSYSE